MKNKLSAFLALALLSTLNPQFSTLFAQGTAFTYQGHLTAGANAANGSYEFRFALFDAVGNGAQIGNAITNSSVPVSAGSFTVTLNFGAGAFSGANRCPDRPLWIIGQCDCDQRQLWLCDGSDGDSERHHWLKSDPYGEHFRRCGGGADWHQWQCHRGWPGGEKHKWIKRFGDPIRGCQHYAHTQRQQRTDRFER